MDRMQELGTLWKDKEMKNQIVEISGQAQATSLATGDAMLQIIDRIASNPDVDIAKMQAVVDMRNQEIARQNAEAFAGDYVQMKAELPLVIKDKNNAQTKSKYAALESVNMQIDPILKKYGFATSTPVKSQSDTHVTVEAILRHRSGHFEKTEITLPIDNKGMQGTVNKTLVHGIASSITYAKRVAICALLNISTGDDEDGNKYNQDVLATDVQRSAIMSLYNKLTDAQQDNFNERTGGVLEIKKADVDRVIATLNKSITDNK